jgi:hypothetical protein
MIRFRWINFIVILLAITLFSCTAQTEISPTDVPPVSSSSTEGPTQSEDHPCRVVKSAESGGDGGDLIGPTVVLVRMSYDGELSEIGTISVPFSDSRDDPYFLNILVDLDQDGIWGVPSASEALPNEWIVANRPIPIRETTQTSFFPIQSPDLVSSASVGVRVVVSGEPIQPIDEWDCAVPSDGHALDTEVQVSVFDSPTLADPAEGFYGGAGPINSSMEGSNLTTFEPIGDDLNLETIFYRSGVPDLDQGPSTCVAHSMANSLAWLAREHNFTDKFQQEKDANGKELPKYDVTTDEGAAEIAWEMIADWEGQKKYSPATGVSPDAIVPGKKSFVNKRGLPITVEKIGDDKGGTTFEAIKEALKEGCDVEVGLEVQTETGPKYHMVTAVGFSDIMIGSSPYRGLTFHDPNTSSEASGPTGGNDLYEYDPKTNVISNYPFLGKLRAAKLTFAVKECYTPPKVSSSGIYSVGIMVAYDPSAHVGFVLMPGILDLTVRQSAITFQGAHPWVEVIGEVDEEGNFEAAGRGVVAGYSNIAVTFVGTIFDGQLAGDYTMGAQGGLPGGQAIVYRVEGERTALLEEPTSQAVINEVTAFFETFNASFRAQSSQDLLDLLHPAVPDLYGLEACQAYLEQIVEGIVQVEVLDVTGPELWLWEIDSHSTEIGYTYTVLANVSAGETTNQRDLHIAQRPDGSFGWFTDCGDPLP